jgi:hypothetical protein
LSRLSKFSCATIIIINIIQWVVEDVSLLPQLKGNLDRTIQEQSAELQRATAALNAAEAEAATQEELAELASGELEEYQRRMAAEVQHARQEALRAVDSQNGGNSRPIHPRTHPTKTCKCPS